MDHEVVHYTRDRAMVRAVHRSAGITPERGRLLEVCCCRGSTGGRLAGTDARDITDGVGPNLAHRRHGQRRGIVARVQHQQRRRDSQHDTGHRDSTMVVVGIPDPPIRRWSHTTILRHERSHSVGVAAQ